MKLVDVEETQRPQSTNTIVYQDGQEETRDEVQQGGENVWAQVVQWHLEVKQVEIKIMMMIRILRKKRLQPKGEDTRKGKDSHRRRRGGCIDNTLHRENTR